MFFSFQGKRTANSAPFGRSSLDVPKEELRDLKVSGTCFADRRFMCKKHSVAAVLFAAAKNDFTAKAFN
ncbi:MAG TPA: hypothetical protein PKY19_07190 [Oscillospiraceae bacterium]|nr:hypothetical protein [Oscillospiraceae bacterium]HXK78246.1 hypothetical protein [Oscillospiraceae bacterium]